MDAGVHAFQLSLRELRGRDDLCNHTEKSTASLYGAAFTMAFTGRNASVRNTVPVKSNHASNLRNVQWVLNQSPLALPTCGLLPSTA